eukprot:gene10259-2409_t
MDLQTVVVVMVHGPSCSGKTTLVAKIKEQLSRDVNCSSLHQDDFYHQDLGCIPQITIEEENCYNWDTLEAIDTQHLVSIFKAQMKSTEKKVIIVEGTLVASLKEIVEHTSIIIFLDAAKALCVRRRQQRTYLGTPDSPNYFIQHAYATSEHAKEELLSEIANEKRSQFILTLVVGDMGVSHHDYCRVIAAIKERYWPQ